MESTSFVHLSTLKESNSKLVVKPQEESGFLIFIRQIEGEAVVEVEVGKVRSLEYHDVYMQKGNSFSIFFGIVASIILLVALLEA